MKVEIHIWSDTPKLHRKDWRIFSKRFTNGSKLHNYIIINHRLKEYRKNFECTKQKLTLIIEKAKNMKECDVIFVNL